MFSVRRRDECVKPSAEIRLPRREIVNSPLTLARKVNQPIVASRSTNPGQQQAPTLQPGVVDELDHLIFSSVNEPRSKEVSFR
ncbi:MAG: hypothetical protein M1410_03685 [Candidatus Thermoplasmatota archaeon]|nr:hypothetical protein [Candidatus Thermoplasmatota archaeon]